MTIKAERQKYRMLPHYTVPNRLIRLIDNPPDISGVYATQVSTSQILENPTKGCQDTTESPPMNKTLVKDASPSVSLHEALKNSYLLG